MALIEHLDRDDWQKNLEHFFEATISLLKEDPNMQCGSAVGDLKAWLRTGGIPRVKEALAKGSFMRRYGDEKKAAILTCVDQLGTKHQAFLKMLHAKEMLRYNMTLELPGTITYDSLNEAIDSVLRGERPFETWMIDHGYTEDDIQAIYAKIDEHLIPLGFIPPKNPTDNLH